MPRPAVRERAARLRDEGVGTLSRFLDPARQLARYLGGEGRRRAHANFAPKCACPPRYPPARWCARASRRHDGAATSRRGRLREQQRRACWAAFRARQSAPTRQPPRKRASEATAEVAANARARRPDGRHLTGPRQVVGSSPDGITGIFTQRSSRRPRSTIWKTCLSKPTSVSARSGASSRRCARGVTRRASAPTTCAACSSEVERVPRGQAARRRRIPQAARHPHRSASRPRRRRRPSASWHG